MKKSPSAESYFQFLGNCPVCQNPFPVKNATFIGQKGKVAQIHVDCRKCRGAALVLVVNNIKGVVTAIGMGTDFTKKDAFRFKDKLPITVDEVLAFHDETSKKGKS